MLPLRSVRVLVGKPVQGLQLVGRKQPAGSAKGLQLVGRKQPKGLAKGQQLVGPLLLGRRRRHRLELILREPTLRHIRWRSLCQHVRPPAVQTQGRTEEAYRRYLLLLLGRDGWANRLLRETGYPYPLRRPCGHQLLRPLQEHRRVVSTLCKQQAEGTRGGFESTVPQSSPRRCEPSMEVTMPLPGAELISNNSSYWWWMVVVVSTVACLFHTYVWP